jgi:phosphohistidine swiveling domain-containing protein
MVTPRTILWLDEIADSHQQVVGGKAANLGAMLRAGFRVPPGFCVLTTAYASYVEDYHLQQEVEVLTQGAGGAIDPYALFSLPMDGAVEKAIHAACLRLLENLPQGTRLAVRSSATTEDMPDASFAGQGETYLNVDLDGVADRVRDCWASLWTARAVSYRRRGEASPRSPEMAVVVQVMVPCDVGGVAFSVDPLGGDGVVIEAVHGLAEAVVQGTGEITRYMVDRRSLVYRRTGDDILSPAQVQRVAEIALALEARFGGAQDLEWGIWNGAMYLFQSRPVTTEAERFFTQKIPGDDYLWTGGYLNERFPRPVSPLGWSVVGGLTEALAFRDPLRYLGYPHLDQLPLTKLYRGHPYTNVAVFQILYKVFPDSVVPDDAVRYFPDGDTGLRKAAPYPCCLLDPRFIGSMLCHFVRDPANWSPLHNHRHWARFVVRHERAMAELVQQFQDASDLEDLWAIVGEAQSWSRELLGIHRWSLMAADLAVPLLSRLVGCWVSPDRRSELSALLLSGVPNKSLELDQALRDLAGETDPHGAVVRDFLSKYGHRSFYLDLYQPTYADDPEQVLRLAQAAGQGPDLAARVAERESAEREVWAAVGTGLWGRLKLYVLTQVLGLARRYVALREDQRFAWQQTLALMRGAFLRIGKELVVRGLLSRDDDIFFATIEQVRALSLAPGGEALCAKPGVSEMVPGGPAQRRPDVYLETRQAIEARRAAFERLEQEFELAPHLTYPAFLRGNRPLESASEVGARRWKGVPVSPGLVRGTVRVVLTPGQFDRIAVGDILVTRSTDPGWTPIFGRLSGLIMERGGQLSHGSVVAREYGLPAVVGIPHITEHLHDGDLVLLDGLTGTVALED